MITDKLTVPFFRFFPAWLLAGIATVTFIIFFSILLKLPVRVFCASEWFYLIQGSCFLLAALWILLKSGVNYKTALHDVNSDIESDLRQALKYIFAYGFVALAALALVVVVCLGLIKAHVLVPEAVLAYFSAPREIAEGQKYFDSILLQSPFKLGIYFFSVCVLIPIEEEIFFRRFLYVYIRHRLSFATTLVVTAVIFGAVHLAGVLPALAAGFFLGWIYEKKQRLPVNIMVHAAVNFLVVLVTSFI